MSTAKIAIGREPVTPRRGDGEAVVDSAATWRVATWRRVHASRRRDVESRDLARSADALTATHTDTRRTARRSGLSALELCPNAWLVTCNPRGFAMKPRRLPQNLVSRRRALERRFGSLASRLWEFAEPHLDPSGQSFDVQRVFALAVAAWNLPFLDTARRNEIVRGTSAADSLLLFDLYVRRLQEYPDDPRMVLGHDLIEIGAGSFSPLVKWAEGVFAVARR